MAKPLIGICPNIRPTQRRGDAYFLLASYVDLVSRGGAMPVILPLAATLEEAREVVGRVDGLLLTGGSDLDPTRYGQTARRPELLGPRGPKRVRLLLRARGAGARHADPRHLPGHSGDERGVRRVAAPAHPRGPAGGAGARRGRGARRRPEHAVAIEPDDPGPGARHGRCMVNSFHHQSVDRVAPGFRVAARSTDGVVEAIERADHPFYVGVQWHPERMPDAPSTRRLMGAFLDAARGAPVKA